MGLPGFCVWLKKKYKKQSVFTHKDSEIQEILQKIDNFYLDLNCAIHPKCQEIISQYEVIKDKNDLERKMINNVLEFLNFVSKFVNFNILYIAVDGVAPVAKGKQQRYRRNKSVYDKQLWDNIKRKHGKELGAFWNSSAISPGTIFMSKLDIAINEWCKNYKVNKGKPENKNKTVIYSSCNVSGEGEHKILEHIKSEPNDKNFLIYGLDADLIFLGMASQKVNVYLLRERMVNGQVDYETFDVVSLNVLRECIYGMIQKLCLEEFDHPDEFDVNQLKKNNIVNDFIFICYFLGNDFLPHLPSIDIYKTGLDYLVDVYVNMLIEHPKRYLLSFKDGKIKFNMKNICKYLKNLAASEESEIQSNLLNNKYWKCQSTDPYLIEKHRIENLQFKYDDPVQLGYGTFEEYRKRYYVYYGVNNKVNSEKVNEKQINELSKQFLEGITWNTRYYFQGCQSWRWFYRKDCAPFLRDIYECVKEIDLNEFVFKKDKPLNQFSQLLNVLSPKSSNLLPLGLRNIMEDEIRYPKKFKLDMVNKHKHFQCNPILPEIDLDYVELQFNENKDKLTKNDLKLNRNGKIKTY